METTTRWSELIMRVLAPNPGPMTLEGTNSYVVCAPQSESTVIVDPGPVDAAHLERLMSHGPIELILLTHRHQDHSDAASALSEITRAPVRAMDPRLVVDAAPLEAGETLIAAGCRIEVIATPGHTADSVCFHLPDDIPLERTTGSGSILTGDTLLGRGSTVITGTDGSLREYLSTLAALIALGPLFALPGHGPLIHDLAAVCEQQIDHRHLRLREIEEALTQLALRPAVDDRTVDLVASVVYSSVSEPLRRAAAASARAQLGYLMEASHR